MPQLTYVHVAQVVYLASVTAGFVAALVIAVRRHRYARRVLSYGLAWAAPLALAEALFLGFCWVSWEAGGPTNLNVAADRDDLLLESVAVLPLKFLGTVLFVVGGMYLGVRSLRPSLPLIRGIERRWKSSGLLPTWPPAWRTLLEAGAVAAVCLAYTYYAVFPLAEPRESELAERILRTIGEGTVANLFLLKGLVSAPLFEEVVFRHFLQRAIGLCFGGRPNGHPAGRAAAIVIASLCWGLGHAGAVDPEWAKLAQTFGIGLALGWLYDRRGLEASVLAHFLFNGASAILMTQVH